MTDVRAAWLAWGLLGWGIVACGGAFPALTDAEGGGGAGSSSQGAGGSGTSTASGGGGGALECVTPDECPGSTRFCEQAVCEDGRCGSKAANQGQPLPESEQVPGDCAVRICDGGEAVTAPAEGDVPVDGKACTGDSCSGGMPSNPPLSAGHACNEDGGNKCDGKGSCVECLIPSDCGPNSFCATYYCNGGSCSAYFQPKGTESNVQQYGDCKTLECNGKGGLEQVVDDGDVPLDIDPLDCVWQGCSAGSIKYYTCSSNQKCENGQCVPK